MPSPRVPLLLLVVLGLIALAGCEDAAAPSSAATPTDTAPNGSAPASADADGAAKPTAAAEAPCLCTEGKAGKPVWCKRHDKGYVDGKEAHCQGCVKSAQEKLGDTGE